MIMHGICAAPGFLMIEPIYIMQIQLGAEGPIRKDAAGFPVEVPSIRAVAAALMGTIQFNGVSMILLLAPIAICSYL